MEEVLLEVVAANLEEVLLEAVGPLMGVVAAKEEGQLASG